MSGTWARYSLPAILLLLWTAAGRADDAADQKMFEGVMKRLLGTDIVRKEYPKKYAWPPKWFIKPNSRKELNAYASAAKVHGAELDEKTGDPTPVVMITQGYLKEVVKGDENVLAVIMGHELAHLTRDHVGIRKGDTTLLVLAFNRDQELEADVDGLRYAVAAGFSHRAGIASAIREVKAKAGYSSFEGLSSTHPTWEERLMLLDKQQSKLWGAMSAFQNGVVFLHLEQYLAAQQCYRAVTKEFPDCHEGWANLGYAALMQYCDALDTDDLRRYDIGQIALGGFYARPESLYAKVRGIDEKLWQDAVKAFNKALELKKDLVLPRMGLGIAYLVHPEGKNARLASKWFEEALQHSNKDAEVYKNRLSTTALLMNAAVADLAAGQVDKAANKLNMADKTSLEVGGTPLLDGLEDALLYNLALVNAKSDDKQKRLVACKFLENYLLGASPDSAWWPLAHERYVKLTGELGEPALPKKELAGRRIASRGRQTASIQVGAETITLSAPIDDAVARLGKDAGIAYPLFSDAKIMLWRFRGHGIDLLAKDKVLAIFLNDSKAPPIKIQAAGLGTKVNELRVGMSEKDAQEVLKGQRADGSPRFLADPDLAFRFYPELGVAVRMVGGRVQQLALAQIPRFSFFEPKEREKGK
jgi:tetratricopeptide (TPR) repeat protein